jgi:phenylacetic acid degradation operon negative regulatory protein
MQARSALFDLYGDYLRSRGGRAPVAALVRLLAPLGITAPAVRTAVSRMVRQGWLHPMRLGSGPGYLLTPKAARRLDEASARIYRTGRSGWDGRFDLILLHAALPKREAGRMAFLGYGSLGENAWVAPRAADEVSAVLAETGLRYERFSASHAAGTTSAAEVVERAWDLGRLGRAYQGFVDDLRPVVTAVNGRSTDEEAYAARFRLVHAWRSFLFCDPQLPAALLPARWAGTSAAGFFDRHSTRLRPAADRYVERCLLAVGRGGRAGFPEP